MSLLSLVYLAGIEIHLFSTPVLFPGSASGNIESQSNRESCYLIWMRRGLFIFMQLGNKKILRRPTITPIYADRKKLSDLAQSHQGHIGPGPEFQLIKKDVLLLVLPGCVLRCPGKFSTKKCISPSDAWNVTVSVGPLGTKFLIWHYICITLFSWQTTLHINSFNAPSSREKWTGWPSLTLSWRLGDRSSQKLNKLESQRASKAMNIVGFKLTKTLFIAPHTLQTFAFLPYFH